MTTVLPPGPKGDFLLGSIRPFAKDPPGFLVEVVREYGDMVFLRLGPYKVYVVAHPDMVREVLVSQARKFQKSKLDVRILSKFLGNGLLTSEGDFHRGQRTLVQPAFHTGRIQAYGRVMVDYTQQMLEKWQKGQTRDVDHEMMRLTMFIVSKTLFDADISEASEKVGLAIQDLQEISNAEYKRAFATPTWLPTPYNLRRRRAIVVVNETIERIVGERRATAKNGIVEDTGDLLSMLLLAQYEDGERMHDRQVRDEAITLFAAGHETTSNALTWTWYLLSQHPDVEAQLHHELEQELAGQSPAVADLGRLTYTQMVIKEAMRLYPPAWILNGRTAMENLTIGGYEIAAGSQVYVSPYMLHRLPRYFPEPERFDPERFEPEKEKEIPRYAYIPFGGGPRVCIGNSFAMMEAQLILATIAQRFALELPPGQVVEPLPQITLGAKDGLKMQLRAR